MEVRISREALGFLKDISRRVDEIKMMLATFLKNYSSFLQTYFNLHRSIMEYVEKVVDFIFYLEMALETARKSIVDEEYLSFLQDYLTVIEESGKIIKGLKKDVKINFKTLLKSLKLLRRSLKSLKDAETLFKGLEKRGGILKKRRIGKEVLAEIQKLKSILIFFCGRLAKEVLNYLDIFEEKLVVLYRKYTDIERKITKLFLEVKLIYKHARRKSIGILRKLDEKIHSINVELLNERRELLNIGKDIVRKTEGIVRRRIPKVHFITEEFRMIYEKISEDIVKELKRIEALMRKEELAKRIIERKHESFLYFNEDFKNLIKKGKEEITNYFRAFLSFLEMLHRALEDISKENLEGVVEIIQGLLNFKIENIVKELIKNLEKYRGKILDIVKTIEVEVIYEIQKDLEFFGEIIRILKEKKHRNIDIGGCLFVLEKRFDMEFKKIDYVELVSYYRRIIKNLKNCIREVKRNGAIMRKELGKDIREILDYFMKKLEEIFRDVGKIERELNILHRYLRRKLEKGKIDERIIKSRIGLFLSKLQKIVEKADERSLEIGDIKLFIRDISQILENCKGKIHRKIELQGVCKRYYGLFTRSLEKSFEELKKSLEEMYKLMHSVNLSIIGLKHRLKPK